jgi:DNA repair protein RecN (Recombination protein N)
LDSYGGTTALRHGFASELTACRALRARLAALRTNQSERAERIAFLQFQAAEIDRVDLCPGELAETEDRHRLLSHLERLRELLAQAEGELRAADDSVLDRLARIARAVDEAAGYDPLLQEAKTGLEQASVLLEDVHATVRSGLSRLELDPGQFAEVEARLRQLRDLLRRYGPDESELFARRRRIAEELEELCGPQSDAEALESELARHRQSLRVLANDLQGRRTKAAHRLTKAVERELRDLGMSGTAVEVRIEPHDDASLLDTATLHGPAGVEIWVTANPGEPARPLAKVASGGEAARIMLSVKKLLADNDCVPVLVFDEIDAEIGGRLGLAIGQKLLEVARHHQTVCVTHLPQIAAFADAHVQVAKEVRAGRTYAKVQVLDEAQRAAELAAMARGDTVDRAALEEARRLRVLARGG